jgi:HEAT repeat protein
VELFAAAILALGGASVLFLVVLASRRVVVGAAERRRGAVEERLRPLALALVDGEQVPSQLPRDEATTLALLLGRYARSLAGEPRRRIAAFFELSGGVDAAIERLGSRRSPTRAEAAFALGDMGSTRAIEPLLQALGDRERDVRAAAARSLARLGATEAVEPLLATLAAGTLPRAVVGRALLELGTAATPPLRALVGHEGAGERATAVQLLGLLGEAADARLLQERLLDTSAEVRAQAALALGGLAASESAATLRETLADRVPFVRAAAAEALGLVKDTDAFEALLVQARDDAFEPAAAAAQSLARIAPDRVRALAQDPEHAGPYIVEAADLLAV